MSKSAKLQLVDRTNSPFPNNASLGPLETPQHSASPHQSEHSADCTLTVIRSLTRPLLQTPSISELKDVLLSRWNIQAPVARTDYTMRQRWQEEGALPLTATTTMTTPSLCTAMFDWNPSPTTSTATLSPYFAFQSPSSPFFEPWVDIGKGMKQLLLNQVACRQHGAYFTLSSHKMDLFLSTGPQFDETKLVETCNNPGGMFHPEYFLLRCRYNKSLRQIEFGYHRSGGDAAVSSTFSLFHPLVIVSLNDDEWRCHVCIVMSNVARILNCLKDYTVPLVWSTETKLRVINKPLNDGDMVPVMVQKRYETDLVCPRLKASVQNMINVYRMITHVPHVDRLVSVVVDPQTMVTVCNFQPVGRAYLPMDWTELVDALICIAEALVALHALHIMHRDIRWANVLHVVERGQFTREWMLFDFEFACVAPQPALGIDTFTPGNHAPEMVDTALVSHAEMHDTAVDIWGFGYMMDHAFVDIPSEHDMALSQLKRQCLQMDPSLRPAASECLIQLRAFEKHHGGRRKKRSSNGDIVSK